MSSISQTLEDNGANCDAPKVITSHGHAATATVFQLWQRSNVTRPRPI